MIYSLQSALSLLGLNIITANYNEYTTHCYDFYDENALTSMYAYSQASYRTYCLMGDGESMEGNIWEALNFAGFYKLDNLCAIIDCNRLVAVIWSMSIIFLRCSCCGSRFQYSSEIFFCVF